MPSYITNYQLWTDLYPIPLFAALISFLLSLLSGEDRSNFGKAFIVIFSMSLLGIIAGQIMGQSREPAVGSVMPSILAMIAGLIIYLVSAKSFQQQHIVALIVIGFSINLLVGSFWGAQLRFDYENHLISEKVLLQKEAVLQNINLQKIKYEKQSNSVRKLLGLAESDEKNMKCAVLSCSSPNK
jgi:hypothetical protein